MVLKVVARDKRKRFEAAEESCWPWSAPQATPLLQCDQTALWKVGLAVSALFNLLLVYWLLFLPK